MDQRINSYRKALAVAVVTAGATLASMTTLAVPPAVVTNGNNDGNGSLRAALGSGASKIMIKPDVKEIMVTAPLEYGGDAPLTILGSGQVIKTMNDIDLLTITEGADLSISKVHFVGPGMWDIYSQGEGIGIFVDVPMDRQGVVQLSLKNVSVSGFAYHGVFVNDCDGGDSCGAGGEGGGNGSPASVSVYLNNVDISEVGTGKFDGDGLRVNERSEGGINFFANHSSFTKVGADGVELDEDDAVIEGATPGDVMVHVTNSVFNNNGSYCNPDILEVDLPDPAEWDGDGDPDLDWITDWLNGDFESPDNSCFEVTIEDEDGNTIDSIDDIDNLAEYEVAIDTDDGFDIDEAGPGGLSGMLTNLDVNDNYDEGLDFDSLGDGDDNFVDLDIMAVRGGNNNDESIKVSEEGNASVVVNMRAIEIEGDVEVEEEDEGDLTVTVNGSYIGDDLKLSEKGSGAGTVKLRGTTVVDDRDFNNVDEI